VGLTVIESAVLRGGAPDGFFVLVSTEDPIEVVIVVVCRGSFGIVPPLPLFLEVPQRDVSLLGISRITLWVRSVRVMSGKPVLRGMSEQPLSESDQALLPVTAIVQLLCDGEFLGLVGSLLSGSSPPAHQEEHEDESASKGHEENLPPLESVGTALRGGGGVDASDTGQGWDIPSPRWFGNNDQLGQANTHPGDNRCTALAARVDTRTGS